MTDRETEKEEFEAWAGREGLGLWQHMPTHEYVVDRTKTAWDAFRAGSRFARVRLLAKQMDCVENCVGELQRK